MNQNMRAHPAVMNELMKGYVKVWFPPKDAKSRRALESDPAYLRAWSHTWDYYYDRNLDRDEIQEELRNANQPPEKPAKKKKGPMECDEEAGPSEKFDDEAAGPDELKDQESIEPTGDPVEVASDSSISDLSYIFAMFEIKDSEDHQSTLGGQSDGADVAEITDTKLSSFELKEPDKCSDDVERPFFSFYEVDETETLDLAEIKLDTLEFNELNTFSEAVEEPFDVLLGANEIKELRPIGFNIPKKATRPSIPQLTMPIELCHGSGEVEETVDSFFSRLTKELRIFHMVQKADGTLAAFKPERSLERWRMNPDTML